MNVKQNVTPLVKDRENSEERFPGFKLSMQKQYS